MCKVNCRKIVILFTFLFVLSNFTFSQVGFEFRGKLIIDKKISKKTKITVFNKNRLVTQTITDKFGYFSIKLQNNKQYVLKFKAINLKPLKVMVQTNYKNSLSESLKTRRQIFTLKSNKPTLKNTDLLTAYKITDTGISETTDIEQSLENFDSKNEITKIKNKVENDKLGIKDSINNLILEEQLDANSKLDNVIFKINNLLLNTEEQSSNIIQFTKKKAKNIIDEAYYSLPRQIENTTKIDENYQIPNKNTLEKLKVDKKKFYGRSDIKKYTKQIEKLKLIKNKSDKESIEYLNSMVNVQEEFIKTAKFQLEIDMYNAKTKGDTLELQKRDFIIKMAEKELKAAKNKIAFQKLEIKQKNTFLFLVIIALIIFIILSATVYNSFIHKKKTNKTLEIKNIEIANKNKKIIDSIRYAQTIQQAILPMKTVIDKHFESFIIFQPKDIVSGDFYWFNHYPENNKSVIAIVDCTGHGVPGAFMSMIANRLLVEIITEKKNFDTVQILEKLDNNLRQTLMQDETSNNDGMDLVICTIEKTDKGNAIVEFAGAKRPLFYTKNNLENLEFIKGTVRGIGGRERLRKKPKKEFQKHILKINKGEILYLTTDGFFDLQSPNRKKFGRMNFMKLIDENKQESLQKQKEIIIDNLHEHKGSEIQIDDITIMGLKI